VLTFASTGEQYATGVTRTQVRPVLTSESRTDCRRRHPDMRAGEPGINLVRSLSGPGREVRRSCASRPSRTCASLAAAPRCGTPANLQRTDNNGPAAAQAPPPAFAPNLRDAAPPNSRIDRTKPNRGAQWAPRLIGFAAHPGVGWRVQSGLVDAQARCPRPCFQPSSRALRARFGRRNAPLRHPDAIDSSSWHARTRAVRLWPKGPTSRWSYCLPGSSSTTP